MVEVRKTLSSVELCVFLFILKFFQLKEQEKWAVNGGKKKLFQGESVDMTQQRV